MKKIGILIIATIVIVSVGLTTTGCGGGKTTTNVEAKTTTLGQELTDLQQAYDKGIITEKEYNDLKKQLMKKYK